MSAPPTTLYIPTEPLKRRAWVQYQLRCRGRTFADLARAESVSRDAIHATLIRPNSHLEPVIAEAIGLTAEQLFPERFGENGERLFATRERSRARRLRNVQRRRQA